ncbi:amino acid permease [Ramlibacter sp.]|uniref:APC family permease n=1 Tax=Ramlibacter sp. TaxID=1917967 RepID=UPI0018001790|nr:amino acid permease [Ramlibacter sp.]MBA2676514.1 amino acid permease [Ramlibacter sp.]
MAAPKGALGRIQGIALYVGAVLGSGVLLIPGVAAEIAGPGSLLAWGAMALLTLPLALTMTLLAARYPGGGGVATFAEKAFGKVTAAFTGWLFLLAVPIGTPLVAIIGASYISTAFGWPESTRVFWAAAIALTAFGSNYLGIRMASKVQVAVVVAITVTLLAAIVGAVPQTEAARFQPFLPHGMLGVAQAMALLFWCFIGWEAVTYLSGEFSNPARDLVPAVVIAVVVVTALYLGTAYVIVGTGQYGGRASEASMVLIIKASLGDMAGAVAGAVAFCSCVAVDIAYVGGASHLARALAEKGMAPQFLGKTHARYGTPVGGLALIAAGTTLVLILSFSGLLTVRSLIALPTANFILTYVLGCAAGVWLARGAVERILALIALVASVAVAPFLGWALLYPLLIGVAVMLIVNKKAPGTVGVEREA